MASSESRRAAAYRAYQFFAALKATLPGIRRRLTDDDNALVESVLPTPSQKQLFSRMSPNDRRHAVAVARTLQQAGHQDRVLLQAALLHDVAKSLGQPIIHRVLIVLLEAFWPAALLRLSTIPSTQKEQESKDELPRSPLAHSSLQQISWWRRPFVIHAHHPAIGAAWAQQVGCDPVAVELILRHQDKLFGDLDYPQQKLLEALQWADNLN